MFCAWNTSLLRFVRCGQRCMRLMFCFPAGEQVDVDCRSEDVSLSLGPLLDRLLGKALSRQRTRFRSIPKPSDAAIRLRDLDLGNRTAGRLCCGTIPYQVSARAGRYDTVQRTFEMNGMPQSPADRPVPKTAPYRRKSGATDCHQTTSVEEGIDQHPCWRWCWFPWVDMHWPLMVAA